MRCTRAEYTQKRLSSGCKFVGAFTAPVESRGPVIDGSETDLEASLRLTRRHNDTTSHRFVQHGVTEQVKMHGEEEDRVGESCGFSS
jgi:hypothetical protein